MEKYDISWFRPFLKRCPLQYCSPFRWLGQSNGMANQVLSIMILWNCGPCIYNYRIFRHWDIWSILGQLLSWWFFNTGVISMFASEHHPFRLSAFPPFRNVSWWNSTTFPLNKCNDQTPGDSQRVSSDLARQMNNGSTWLMQATGRRRVSRIDATWSLVFITNPIGIALGILAVLRSWDNQEPGWARLCGQASLQLPNIHWSSKNTQMELSWNRATPSSHPF